MYTSKTPTFSQERKRRFRCRKCKSYIGSKEGGVVYSRLEDNKIKELRCRKCGYKGQYSPPVANGQEVYWGSDENMLDGTTTMVDEDRL